MVFVGFATDDAYSLAFRTSLMALQIGVILTPIYLLSAGGDLREENELSDANLVMLSHADLHHFLPAGADHRHWPLPEAGHRQLPGHD